MQAVTAQVGGDSQPAAQKSSASGKDRLFL
jgi:hypothetical protein